MNEDLRQFMIDNSDPDTLSISQEAFELLEDMYPVQIHDHFTSLVMNQENQSMGGVNTLELVVYSIREYLKTILQEHKITLNPQIDYLRLVRITKALIQVQEYESRSDLEDILFSEEDNEMKLALILALSAPYDAYEIVQEIEYVDQELIEQFIEFCKDLPQTIITEPEVDIEKYISKLKLFEKEFGGSGLVAMHLVRNGLKPGYTFEVNMTLATSIDPNDAATVVAKELLAMAYISCDAIGNAKQVIRNYMTKTVQDMRVCIKVDSELTKLLTHMDRLFALDAEQQKL